MPLFGSAGSGSYPETGQGQGSGLRDQVSRESAAKVANSVIRGTWNQDQDEDE